MPSDGASDTQKSRPLGAWKARTFQVEGLGTVEAAPPTVGQVEDAQKHAAVQPDETAQGETFFASLLDSVLISPRLGSADLAGLSEGQKLTLSRALASSLACEAEFDAETGALPAPVRLYRADRERWKKLLGRITGALAPTDRWKEVVEKLALDVSPLLDTLRRDMGSFRATVDLLKDLRMPQLGQLYLPVLRAAKIDAPLLYPPTSIWRDPLPAEAETIDHQQQRWMRAYEMVMHVETRLRLLIERELLRIHGDNWWKRGVPEAVRSECERRKAEKGGEAEAESHPLAYSYIDQLRQIIARRDNWETCFERYFSDPPEAQVWMKKVGQYRQATMHFRRLDEDDFLFLTAACRWLLSRLSPRRGKTDDR